MLKKTYIITILGFMLLSVNTYTTAVADNKNLDYAKTKRVYQPSSLKIKDINEAKRNMLKLFSLTQSAIKENDDFKIEKFTLEAINTLENIEELELAKADFIRILSSAYLKQRRYNEAEPYLEEAIKIYEKHKETQGLNQADALRKMAIINISKNEYVDARLKFEKTYEICKQVLGESNEKTQQVKKTLDDLNKVIKQSLDSKNSNNSAHLYFQKGLNAQKLQNYQEAEYYYIKAIEDFKKNSLKNKNYLLTLQNLSAVYIATTRFKEASKLFDEIIPLAENVLEKKSREYIIIISNIGLLYSELAMYEKAETILKKSIAIEESMSKCPYEQYYNSLNSLAELYRKTNRLEKAEYFYKKAMNVGEKNLEKNYIALAAPINGLALVYEGNDKLNEAEELFKKAIKVAGANNDKLNLPRYLSNLAEFYRKTKQFEKAETYYSKSLDRIKDVLGENNTTYSAVLGNFAILLCEQEKHKQAKPLALQSYKISSTLLNKNHPSIATALKIIAIADIGLGNYKEADSRLMQASNIIISNFGLNHPQIKEINHYRKKIKSEK